MPGQIVETAPHLIMIHYGVSWLLDISVTHLVSSPLQLHAVSTVGFGIKSGHHRSYSHDLHYAAHTHRSTHHRSCLD